MGPDGWCIHYDKGTRKCSIYNGEHPGGQNFQQLPSSKLFLYGPDFILLLSQIALTFVVCSQMYLNICMELAGRSLTKKLAGLLIISYSFIKHWGN